MYPWLLAWNRVEFSIHKGIKIYRWVLWINELFLFSWSFDLGSLTYKKTKPNYTESNDNPFSLIYEIGELHIEEFFSFSLLIAVILAAASTALRLN
jgi:hypothetical protein